ncbi:hypothetical protein Tco_1000865 [Tanacetum coccineum]
MIKYSFGQDEEYGAVKEDKYEDLTSTSEDACRAYQEIFRMMDEGWMETNSGSGLKLKGSKQSHIKVHFKGIIAKFNAKVQIVKVIMTKVIKEEFEQLGLLKISNDLFTYDTQLGMIFNEFNRLSGINDDLFNYEIEVPKPTSRDEQQTSNPTHKDIREYEWKMSYEECEKIYAKAVIFINKRLVKLIDVTVEQWLDLKYGNHKTMDKNVKKGVIGAWLIRSYKLQFEEYLEIKKQRDT